MITCSTVGIPLPTEETRLGTTKLTDRPRPSCDSHEQSWTNTPTML